MDARIGTSPRVVPTAREAELLKHARKLRRGLLCATAAGMVAAFWVVVPIAGLSGIYYPTNSAIAPLCLAGGLALLVALHYTILSRMLLGSDELLDFERPLVFGTAAPEVEAAKPALREDLERPLGTIVRTAA